MTKIFLSIFVLLLAFPVLACKPGGLPVCDKYNVKVDEDQYNELTKLVKSYQGILTKAIKWPDRASSCFNNNFGVYYSEALKASLKDHKGKTCKEQIERVRSQIQKLIDKESDEFKTISNTSDKKHLKREAKKVKIAMICLP